MSVPESFHASAIPHGKRAAGLDARLRSWGSLVRAQYRPLPEAPAEGAFSLPGAR